MNNFRLIFIGIGIVSFVLPFLIAFLEPASIFVQGPNMDWSPWGGTLKALLILLSFSVFLIYIFALIMIRISNISFIKYRVATMVLIVGTFLVASFPLIMIYDIWYIVGLFLFYLVYVGVLFFKKKLINRSLLIYF